MMNGYEVGRCCWLNVHDCLTTMIATAREGTEAILEEGKEGNVAQGEFGKIGVILSPTLTSVAGKSRSLMHIGPVDIEPVECILPI